jgi:carbon monoxide dehydrogenase subunit G
MRFEHEFTVEVPLEEVWTTVSGPDALAASLPGASLRAIDGMHAGRIELGGGQGLACEATIAALDQDDDEHVATVSVHGRQVEGPGIGSATLRSRLSQEGSATRVKLVAEVLTTGHGPGNGFEAGARSLFDAVAEGLERQARERPAPVAVPPPEEAAAMVPAARSWLERTGGQKQLIGGAAALLIAGTLLRRMRRRS